MVINGHEIPFILLRLISKDHYFVTCRSGLLKERFGIAQDFEIALYSASRLVLENSMVYDPEVAFAHSLVIGGASIRQGELSAENIVIIGSIEKEESSIVIDFSDPDRLPVFHNTWNKYPSTWRLAFPSLMEFLSNLRN
ncbi:hypothetical protein RUR49_05230 [Pseudoxanthobacter sp. M-2]|uniref:hypothetical protein n=1 Tax=Pseudoxanthobacter sp. M-2 TaxID=3078754 RepID=UPI0038FD3536